jgi:dienelactone hydrolase
MRHIPALLAALLLTIGSTRVAPQAHRATFHAGSARAGLPGMPKREMNIKTADGVILKGTYYPAEISGPGVLLFHMCDGTGRAAWESLASRLAQSGFHVLTFNYRGVGDSAGEKFQGGSLEEVMAYWRTKWGPDAESALALLLSQPGVSQKVVGAGGASCGVYMSLQLAQRRPELVKTLVLLAGPTDEEAQAFIDKSARLPILSVASEDDHRSAEWMTSLSALSKNRESKLIMYKNAGHGTNMFAKENELEPMIVEWFKRTLR